MAPETIVRFNDSLARCLERPGFLDRFYERFVSSSPEVAEMFERTEFERQKLALRSSLYMMVMAVEGEAAALEYLERIAASHSRTERDIPPPMYDAWLESLIATAREHDPEFDELGEAAWRAMMGFGIAFMRERYRGIGLAVLIAAR